MKNLSPFYWSNECLYILNQKKLPVEIEYIKCSSYKDVAKCIKEMVVRGAPAIGIVAGYAMAIGIKEFNNNKNIDFIKYLKKLKFYLSSTRPTAVNLFWSINKIYSVVYNSYLTIKTNIYNLALNEAKKIHQEEIEKETTIAKIGIKIIKNNSVILTHCNAGKLATGGIGTALGVIIEAYRQGKVKKVYVDETRPYLQGAKLTMLELMNSKVPCELITDNMAGYVMKTKCVNYIIVGADRIAKNGDTANKIGTYSLSILAKYHNIPFYVVAPSSTIDSSISNGANIKIEERPQEELKYINNKLITLKNAKVFNPAFDITPAELITGIITEKGIYRYPYNFT